MTAPCRCRDLRRALLGLVRASKRNLSACQSAGEIRYVTWDSNVSFGDIREAREGEYTANWALRRSIRRARRLLRETRVETQSEVIDPDLAVMAPGDIAARFDALNRIMTAWLAHENATVPHAWSDSETELHNVLRSVARELGFGGEDGGVAK